MDVWIIVQSEERYFLASDRKEGNISLVFREIENTEQNEQLLLLQSPMTFRSLKTLWLLC